MFMNMYMNMSYILCLNYFFHILFYSIANHFLSLCFYFSLHTEFLRCLYVYVPVLTCRPHHRVSLCSSPLIGLALLRLLRHAELRCHILQVFKAETSLLQASSCLTSSEQQRFFATDSSHPHRCEIYSI